MFDPRPMLSKDPALLDEEVDTTYGVDHQISDADLEPHIRAKSRLQVIAELAALKSEEKRSLEEKIAQIEVTLEGISKLDKDKDNLEQIKILMIEAKGLKLPPELAEKIRTFLKSEFRHALRTKNYSTAVHMLDYLKEAGVIVKKDLLAQLHVFDFHKSLSSQRFEAAQDCIYELKNMGYDTSALEIKLLTARPQKIKRKRKS